MTYRVAANRAPKRPRRSLSIRGFTDTLLLRIKREARKNGRALSKHIVMVLEQAHP